MNEGYKHHLFIIWKLWGGVLQTLYFSFEKIFPFLLS